MLNRDLLMFRRRGKKIVPLFEETASAFQAACSTMLAIYQQALQKNASRAQLQDNLEPLFNSSGDKKLAALNKLLMDHCIFTSASELENAPLQREMIFKYAAKILQLPPDAPELFRQQVARMLAADSVTLPEDIYCDLPEFDRLTSIPPWTAEELVNIYNIAQVQGLLLYADNLEVTVSDTEPMALRKFMRRLKFYRLLAEVKRASANEIKLTLSGPASVFGENRKYGLQLAAFFQVILLMKNWKIRAELQLGKTTKGNVLALDSADCPLRGNIRRWAACLPDEVALFIKTFRQEAGEWREAPEAELPRIANCGTFFPDFSFERSDAAGKVIHVELFHRYYFKELEGRLAFLEKEPNFPLVIGADRVLLDSEQQKLLTGKYPSGAAHLFFYSNYPGVEKLRRMLNKVCTAVWGDPDK